MSKFWEQLSKWVTTNSHWKNWLQQGQSKDEIARKEKYFIQNI